MLPAPPSGDAAHLGAAEQAGRLKRQGSATLAWRRVEGAGPTVVWMGGYRSDMAGTKAEALAAWAARSGRAFLRFDWTGHGESGGDFEAATVTDWRLDALHVLDALVEGPAVLVGSSMGGWVAVLAALARARAHRRPRPRRACARLHERPGRAADGRRRP